MIQFLKNLRCNGLPPAQIPLGGLFERNALVSRMMLEQDRVMVISAPAMMGKTSLAGQYAKAAHSFERVLWLDTAHPRILRGLYDGVLLEGILSALPEGGLVVFEDVPAFAEEHRKVFAGVCASLSERGYRVLVTCTPPCNPLDGTGLSFARFGSEDLLYSDDELAELRCRGYLPMETRGGVSRFGRIPGLLNCPPRSVERFLLEQQNQVEGSFQKYLLYVMVLLSCGTLKDLSRVMGAEVGEGDLLAGECRPYIVQLDFGEGFLCEGFPPSDVLKLLKQQMPQLEREDPSFDRDACFSRLARLLLDRGAVDKATRVVVEACGPETRLAWTQDNISRIVQTAAPLNALLLVHSLEMQDRRPDARLTLWDAISRFLLGEVRTASSDFNAVAGDSGSGLGLRLRAAMFAGLTSGSHPSAMSFGGGFGECCLQARKAGKDSPSLRLWNAFLEGDNGISQLAGGPRSREEVQEWILAAACCIRGIALQGRENLAPSEVRAVESFLPTVARVVDSCALSKGCEAVGLLLRRELECLGMGVHLGREAISFLDQASARMRVQRAAYSRLVGSQGWDQASFGMKGSQDPARYMCTRSSVMSIPVLEVRMFGGFDATVGGVPLDAERLSRMKVRSLLVLLALEQGKEVSCERLGALLWPDSTEDRARRNFYSIFSILRRALLLDDGSCPYLTRSQGVCRLAAPYIKTDAADLMDVCQKMRYGELTGEDAPVLLERMRGIYRGELLPGERTLLAIESARRAWCGRVVDACIAAAGRLRDIGEVAVSLEYAMFAFECDLQREDACEFVMTLQCGMRQRTAAIETFFEYQRANRELGLSPSRRMLALYDRIINDEMPFGE